MLSNQLSYSACAVLAKNSTLFRQLVLLGSSRFTSKKLNFRFLSSAVLNCSNAPTSEEVYKGLFPWENRKALVKHILDTGIIYNDGVLVAINKPYGLAVRSPTKQAGVRQTLNTVLCSSYQGSLDQLLPHLASHLGYHNLHVIKSTERYSSGVTLLSSDAKMTEKVRKCYLRVASSKQLCQHYVAVTVGAPTQLHTEGKIAFTLQQSKHSGIKQAVVSPTATSSNAVKRGDCKMVNVKLDCLHTNSTATASLVQISASTTSWHFLRVYLASLLSPVLGDNVHGARVSYRSGQPSAVNPFSHATQLPAELPPALLRQLELRPKQQALVPVHLHHSKLLIPGFNSDNTELVLQAPLPSTFVWTCDKLALHCQST